MQKEYKKTFCFVPLERLSVPMVIRFAPTWAHINGGVYMSKAHQILAIRIIKGLTSMENGTLTLSLLAPMFMLL